MTALKLTVRAALFVLAAGLSTALAAGVSGRQPPAPQAPAAGVRYPVLEGFPDAVQARLEQRQRALAGLAAPSGIAPGALLNVAKRWQPGQTLRIAFKGGTPQLHKELAEIASEWTLHANLKFDFGLNPATGTYRTWSPADTTFTPNTAEIRVAFDHAGFYSLVGNDSTNPSVALPGEASLNLGGFDLFRPADWQAVTRHEFGHAIGFEHEHQSPLAPCDFRYFDDQGYVLTKDSFEQYTNDTMGRRPGLYTLLSGKPNQWPQWKVDFNLKQLPASSAFDTSTFDKKSIMKYFFSEFMFVTGVNSGCYTSSESVELSDGDKAGAAKLYPRADADIAAAAVIRGNVLEQAVKTSKLAPADLKHFQSELNKSKR